MKTECPDVFRNIWPILHNFYNSAKKINKEKINILNELQHSL